MTCSTKLDFTNPSCGDNRTKIIYFFKNMKFVYINGVKPLTARVFSKKNVLYWQNFWRWMKKMKFVYLMALNHLLHLYFLNILSIIETFEGEWKKKCLIPFSLNLCVCCCCSINIPRLRINFTTALMFNHTLRHEKSKPK